MQGRRALLPHFSSPADKMVNFSGGSSRCLVFIVHGEARKKGVCDVWVR